MLYSSIMLENSADHVEIQHSETYHLILVFTFFRVPVGVGRILKYLYWREWFWSRKTLCHFIACEALL